MVDGKIRSQGNDYDISSPITSSSGLRQGLTAYGDQHFSLFLRKVFIKALGYSEDALSRPIIGIINTYSGFNPCHANVPQLIEAAKRGVQLNGGLAIEFPTISVHESFSHPTSMFLRNLMSMDTEEMIRAQPLDACIMIGGSSTNSSVLQFCMADWARLRQDRPCTADGWHLCEQANCSSRNRANAAGKPPWESRRRVHRLPEQLGSFSSERDRHRGDIGY